MKYRSIAYLLPLLLVAIWVLKPTLQGGFIFDDEHSLSKLQYLNDEVTVERLWYYLGHADTGPLKRPIAVFSFVIDAQNWPADPQNFKRTNLIIHLLNGSLLFFLLLMILRPHKQRLLWATFFCGFWLLHPYLVSTTAYVVQRMTMLSTGFILASLLLYCVARWHEQHRWLPLILWGGLTLSVLSKENGVLLLLLLPLTERLVCQQHWGKCRLPVGTHRWVVVGPVLVFVLLFLLQMMNLDAGYQQREFTWLERLLTQFRMLAKYLYHWLVPQYFTEGVFGDGIRHSESLFRPITTLFSLLLITGLSAMAWLVRKRWPLLAFAVGFYLVGHLIESTVFPLELYFEHRNYLAALFIPLGLVYMDQFDAWKPWPWVLLATLLLHLSIQTHRRAVLWSDNFLLHKKTMERYPESIRATMYTANFYDWQGRPEQALQLLSTAHQRSPQLQYLVYAKFIDCKRQQLQKSAVNEVVTAIDSFDITKHDFRPLGYLVYGLIENRCGLDQSVNMADRIVHQIEHSLQPDSTMGWSFVHYAKGRIQFERKQFAVAANSFLQALAIEKSYLNFLRSVSNFLAAGEAEIAKHMLLQSMRQYEQDFAMKPDFLNIKEELDYFLKTAEEDINRKP